MLRGVTWRGVVGMFAGWLGAVGCVRQLCECSSANQARAQSCTPPCSPPACAAPCRWARTPSTTSSRREGGAG